MLLANVLRLLRRVPSQNVHVSIRPHASDSSGLARLPRHQVVCSCRRDSSVEVLMIVAFGAALAGELTLQLWLPGSGRIVASNGVENGTTKDSAGGIHLELLALQLSLDVRIRRTSGTAKLHQLIALHVDSPDCQQARRQQEECTHLLHECEEWLLSAAQIWQARQREAHNAQQASRYFWVDTCLCVCVRVCRDSVNEDQTLDWFLRVITQPLPD